MIKVDAIGQTCPMPLIMTKKALREITEGIVEVSVDNIISKENVEKLAKESGYHFQSLLEGSIYKITIQKTLNTPKAEATQEDNTVVVIASDVMGDGDRELGTTLIKGFIYTLSEMENLPKTIIFYNKGVSFVSEIESTIKDLKVLESRGVKIISCGACLNFYGLQDKVQVGTISNMLSIIETQMKATRIIRP
ncbi:sulfurtransferase-like selenium metabolism protein YedF [Cetobacterium sp. SF1]|uniref:sulfurtransferase-like selenium metabolism protein YedF n=1 Tax=Cetobacterium sp. SF1 TaxID=3417654 RepID=UPI003CF0938B